MPLRKCLVPLGLSALLAASVFTAIFQKPVQAAANNTVRVTINGEEQKYMGEYPFIDHGTVYAPLKEISQRLKARVDWNEETKEAHVHFPERNLTLKIGASEGLMNGKPIKLTEPMIMHDGHIFVPLRFLAETNGAQVDWDAKSKTVVITRDEQFLMSMTMSGVYWLNKQTGELYESYPYTALPQKVGKMDVDIHDSANMDTVYFYPNKTGVLVTVVDNFGEPHINYNVYTAYMNHHKIIRQAKASYYKRYESNVRGIGEHPVMTDGRTLYVLDDQGNVINEYDLVALGGWDETYSVTGMGESYLIIRPNQTGFLTLIDLNTKQKTLLYKVLLNDEEQEYAETNDIPYFGDGLEFIWERDGTLAFRYHSIFDDKDHIVKHQLAKPDTGKNDRGL